MNDRCKDARAHVRFCEPCRAAGYVRQDCAAPSSSSDAVATLRRYILINRAIGPVGVARPELLMDVGAACIDIECSVCGQAWNRVTAEASWGTVQSIVGHDCGAL